MSAVDDLLASATSTAANQAASGEPERDGWGRYLIPGLDGNKKAHTRATTVAKTLSDTYNLEQWAKRMTALGLTMRPDLFARIAATAPADKRALNILCDEAQEAAGASVGRNHGTALHSFTETVDRGDTINIPAPWDADVVAYRAEMVRAGVRIVPGMIERVVVLEELGVAGTFDRLCTLRRYFRLPLVADLKTATEICDWNQIAIQLAMYAHADFIFDLGTGQRVEMPEVDRTRALVMHLPPGKATCTLHLVDIEAGWEAVQLAMATRKWRTTDVHTALATLEGQTTAAEEADVADRAEAAANLDDTPAAVEVSAALIDETNQVLRARLRSAVEAGATGVTWPAGVRKFPDGGPETWEHVLLAEAVVSDAEASVGAPFLAALPADPTAPPAEPRTIVADVDELVDTEPPRPAIPAEDMNRLKAIHDDLPVDLQAMALEQAVANGVPADRRQWSIDHLETVDRLLGVATHKHLARVQAIRDLLPDDTDPCLLLAVIGAIEVDPAGDGMEHMTQAQLDLAAAVMAAVDAGSIGFGLDDNATPTLVANETAAEAALLFAHSTKAAVLAAAKDAAETLGRPKPRSTAQVVTDPLLVAVLTATGATPSSN